MTHVVTCFLRRGGRILLARRSDAAGTYPGRWAGVSGYVEGDPDDALDDAQREVCEETGLDVSAFSLVHAGDPLDVVDRNGSDARATSADEAARESVTGREWTVHPFLFDVSSSTLDPNEEIAELEWAHAPTIRERETVPGLWETYRRVAPTLADVHDDTTHGSAYVSLRALELLRDTAASSFTWDSLATDARNIRTARPAMAAVATYVDRVMATADRTPEAVREAAEERIDTAARADDEAAERLVELLDGRGPVVTLSRSGTVLTALRAAGRPVIVGESRPACEGVGVAERLAEVGLDATLTTDAALPWLLSRGPFSAVVVGADAVLADGSVVNKTGTRSLALAATREGVPFYVVASTAKIRPDEVMHGEVGPSEQVYDGDAPLIVENPTFDRTPADLVAGVVTERGVLLRADIVAVAAEHAANAQWFE